MAKKVKGKQFRVKFSAVSIGERAASVSITFKINAENPKTFVGNTWEELSVRRLSGALMTGDEMPSQANFGDRVVIEGTFDTGRPSFKDETVALKITFDHSEIAADDLIQLSFREGWIQIEGNLPIPAKKKEPETGSLAWELQPISVLGIDDRVVAKFDNNGLKNCGDVIEVLMDAHKTASKKSLKLTDKQANMIASKLSLYLEGENVENPLLAAN